MRILCNLRDVDGDNTPDIDKAFQLASRFSNWNTEGRQLTVTGAHTFAAYHIPRQGCELRVVAHGDDPAVEFVKWETAIDDATASFKYGQSLPATLATPVFENTDTPGGPSSLWEITPMQSSDFHISAVAHRFIPDISPRFATDGKVPNVPSLDSLRAQQMLPGISANNLSSLLDGLSPAQIRSISVIVDVTWRDSERMLVLTVTLPLAFRQREN